MLDRPPSRPIEGLASQLTAEDAVELFSRALSATARVLIAVSGGADSTALLVLATDWARGPGRPEINAATVDHRLRPQSRAEAEAVAALCGRLGVGHAILAGAIAAGEAGVEERARDARYAALVDHARVIGADAIATAHTLDDQAETVLLRLSAGSGPGGLAGMRAATSRDGVLHLRPLLGVAKSRLVATLLARGVPWSEDAMNRDGAFARARLRASRTALAREGLTPQRLATLAARMARADDALEAATDAAERAHFARDGEGWTIAAAALSDEIRIRLLARALFPSQAVRLGKLERLAARIAAEPLGAATIAGMRVAWQAGAVSARPAPPRRGGATPPGPV